MKLYLKLALLSVSICNLDASRSPIDELKGIIQLLPHERELYTYYTFEKAYELGHQLRVQGYYAEALSLYKVAFALAKQEDLRTTNGINFWLGSAYQALGDLRKGFIGWANQWYFDKEFQHKLWKEENLHGKTILVQPHLGLGDLFQYLRYLKLLKATGARVIFRVYSKSLKPIFSCCPYIDRVTSKSVNNINYHYQVPISALPYYFCTDLYTIPCPIPYIYPNEQLIKMWHSKLANDGNFKVGICWRGRSHKDPQYKMRSIPLNKLESLFELPKISIYSLQVGDGQQEAASFKYKDKLHIFGPEFDRANGSFMDTAAVMKNIDLVITIDSSLAHLAGALGVPVWVMLPYSAECRFLMYRPDSPWYPTMKLIRQSKPNDWDSVCAELIKQIKQINRNLKKIKENRKER